MPWLQLQHEDVNGFPHHKTGQDLELSARSCPLCHLVLQAATEHYRNYRASRTGKNYWYKISSINSQDGSMLRKLSYHKSFGAYSPERNDTFCRGMGAGVTSVAPLDSEEVHTDNEDRNHLNLATKNLGVWVYANLWAASPPSDENDGSYLRLVGFGARYGSSKYPWDAYGTEEDSINLRSRLDSISPSTTTREEHAVKLRGSAISVCAPDGG